MELFFDAQKSTAGGDKVTSHRGPVPAREIKKGQRTFAQRLSKIQHFGAVLKEG